MDDRMVAKLTLGWGCDMIATRTYKRSYEIGKEEFNVKASKKKQAKLDRRRRQYDYMKSEKNGFKRPGSRKK